MVGLISQHRGEIEALCRKYGLRKLELFGSATDELQFNPETSDVDFLYDIDPEGEEDLVDRYFSFLEGLEAILGRKVDLVCAKQIRNPFFLAQVNKERVTLYAA